MKKKNKVRIDRASVAGLIVAAVGILGGLALEGGRLQDVQQITAAVIVLGGTIGAVMITTPGRTLTQAFRVLPRIFTEPVDSRSQMLETVIALAGKARRSGIISLDDDLQEITDPFLHKALMLAVDGTDPQELRAIMDLQISRDEVESDSIVRVYESAGGYAPTIGIIGAVLGLIQVMKQLGNIEEVGRGIAVAFVATVYGVGIANLLLLPAANKLRAAFAEQTRTREMILEGVVSIIEGLNPRLTRIKLETFLPSTDLLLGVPAAASLDSTQSPAWSSSASSASNQIP